MITWEWTRQTVDPDDVLDAAHSIPVKNERITQNITAAWMPAQCYLNWALAALERGKDDAWDAASSWAKRAVCRQMDGILAHNHLGCFLGRNNESKSKYLTQLGVPGLGLLQEVVIDPRNAIEHAYEAATVQQARRACDAAKLFLAATEKQAEIPAIVALGWNLNIRETARSTPGQEFRNLQLELTKVHSPMLFIAGYPDAPEVLIISPEDETVCACPLKDFSTDQVILLNNRLRECLKSQNYSARTLDPAFLAAMTEQLKL